MQILIGIQYLKKMSVKSSYKDLCSCRHGCQRFKLRKIFKITFWGIVTFDLSTYGKKFGVLVSFSSLIWPLIPSLTFFANFSFFHWHTHFLSLSLSFSLLLAFTPISLNKWLLSAKCDKKTIFTSVRTKKWELQGTFREIIFSNSLLRPKVSE